MPFSRFRRRTPEGRVGRDMAVNGASLFLSRTVALLALTSIAALSVSACSSGEPTAATASSVVSDVKGQVSGYPVKLTNCGVQLTFKTPPQRVVAIKSTSTDMLLALGLGSRIVGTAFQDSPVAPEYEQSAAKLPSLAAKVPNSETLLKTKPDLVYSGWESAFKGDAAGERSTLQQFGVSTFVEPSACRSTSTSKYTFDALYSQVAQMGSIMGAAPAAKTVNETLKSELTAIKPAGQGRSVVWWSSDSKSPYVGAGTGAPDAIMEAVGLKNSFATQGKPWANVSWESLAQANPDVIVIADATWSKGATKLKKLKENPATANLDAVKQNRIVLLPFAVTEPGVRNVEGAQALNAAIAKFGK